jgi:hypothetical protein
MQIMRTLFVTILFLATQGLGAQTLSVRETVSRDESPTVVWQTVRPLDTLDFRIFRASVRDRKFIEIHTMHYVQPADTGDTLFLYMTDTTLTKKGLYLYYAEVLRDGRQVVSATALAHNLGLIDVPQVLRFSATPLTDRKAVHLSWTLSDTVTVATLTLYRSGQYAEGYEKVADLAPADTGYTDVIPRANEPWFYFLEIRNYFGGTTRSVRTPAFATFREKPFPPQDVTMSAGEDSVVFDWRNVGNNIIGFRVYRSADERPFLPVSGLQPAGPAGGHYADKDSVMRKAYHLRYILRNVSDGFVESNITDTFEVYIPEHQSVYPPAQLDHVPDAAGHTRLLWMPDDRGFIIGYNVYVTGPSGDTAKLNSSLLTTNAFTDTLYRAPGQYVYLVEGVGMKGKRSERRARTVVEVLPPRIEVLLDLQRDTTGLRISWKRPAGGAVERLELYRQTGSEKPVLLKAFSAAADGTYTDSGVTPGKVYLYRMTAILPDGTKVPLDDATEMRF